MAIAVAPRSGRGSWAGEWHMEWGCGDDSSTNALHDFLMMSLSPVSSLWGIWFSVKVN